MTRSDLPDLTVRTLTGPEEVPLYCRLPYTLNDEIADDLAAGRRRPSWLWLALRGDRVMARAGWWAPQGDDRPSVLDVFDLDDTAAAADRVDIGVALLRTALARMFPGGADRPGFSRFVPPDWREDPEQHRAVQERLTALERSGATPLVERLRLQWPAGGPVAEPNGRLSFRPAADRAELVGLMARVLDGTLDAHSRSELARMSAEEHAALQYDGEFATYRTPRDWWRVATLPGGEPVGFVVPAHNAYGPIIAYIAVLPEYRGRGYVDDVLAEGTRVLAAAGAPRIRASTDVANVPMAKAFARAGYPVFERRLDMVWR